ncbi:transcription factor [Turnera subulata]|uniref:Transcription factor n=1 Tax=Turnera subulata TaxID=218843 RepID=A0A9Q0G3T0_9ROSI|nr:transcription factor [Turnera subulata]
MEVLWRTSGQEEDEKALNCATLERLPTYDCLRKGLWINQSKDGAADDQINIPSGIGLEASKDLVNRLVKVAQDDNEQFLLKLRNRFDAVGIKLPAIEVRFEHVKVEAEADAASRALPSMYNFSVNMFEGILNYLHILPSKRRHLSILKDVSGIIKPSRITLLLGPPSSGKTTLLLALVGKLDSNLKVSGDVTYNGHTMKEFVPQRTAAYISQYDLHLAQMTVRETLAFSARCQGVGFQHDMLVELLRREKEENIKPDPDIDVFMKAVATEGQQTNVVTDYVLKILGLEACADTMVGNEIFRGISGGERKRLTTGEMLVGPAKVLLMDEISTGLDSSTTFQIVNSLKQYVHILNGTAVISLLQPAPETYDLFDDIILLSDGQIVYQGPREFVLDFFERMGFRCPERKGAADFLQEVTSRKDQEQYWANKDQPYSFVSEREFAEAFQSFHVGRDIGNELSTPFDKTKNQPAALATQKYGVGKMELLNSCFSREYLLMKRNAFVYIFKLGQLILQAFIGMTFFLRTEMHRDSITHGQVYMGALYFCVTSVAFNSLAELSLTVAKLPVFYKQRNFLFYPAWAFSLPLWILKVPLTVGEAAIWVFTTYYAIGFDPSVLRFFRQLLVFLLLNQATSALFRFVAAVGRNMIIAYSLGVLAMSTLLTLSGFAVSRDRIYKWSTWMYWTSPVMYAQNAVVVNEFLGESWSHVPPNSTEPLGVGVMKSMAFFTHAYWFWIGVGALTGYVLLLNIGLIASLTFLNPFEKARAIVPDESQNNDPEGRTGGGIQLSRKESGDEVTKSSSSGALSMRTDVTGEANQSKKKGMILPFEPHSIIFDDIMYSVDMPQELKNMGILKDRLVLLKGVSGAFRPGVLTALMGVTGAGKTTLLDVLAGRKTRGYTEGSISVSGYPKKQETFSRISGYCEQTDIHSPHVTVFESILYSAWLRLPSDIDTRTRMVSICICFQEPPTIDLTANLKLMQFFIEEVMELVELNELRQAFVGLPGFNGLSMEQRKRLTIAVELVANPSIIFMDEPTSGLDARAAAIVMRTIRNTVDTGRTVVCTIHQPSIDIFDSFDELFLLKKGGQEIYAGPLGHNSAHLIQYFEAIEGITKVKDGQNPATWMLEVTNLATEIALGVDFAALYRNSELYRHVFVCDKLYSLLGHLLRNKALIKEMSTPAPDSKDLHFPTRFSQPSFTQFKACLWKQRQSYWRNPPYTAVKFLFATTVALLFGSIYWDVGSQMKNREDLFNSMASMYLPLLFIGIQTTTSVQPVVAVERTVFYRERAAGMYSALPYAFAQILIELPYVFVQSTLYGVIVYAMIGFEWTAAKLFWYLFFVYFTLLYFTFYGMMSVAITPNQHISYIVSTMFYGIWNLFSGFIIPQPLIPVWWRWYYWMCPISWSLYGLLTSQYGNINDRRIETGKTVAEVVRIYFGYENEYLGGVAAVVVGFGVLFAFVYAFAIKLFNFQRR